MTTSHSIRPIEKEDVETLYEMICALAAHENERQFVTISPERLAETGFGENPKWRGFFVDVENTAVAYVTYTQDFHIWSGALRITIDDLFVRPEFRRHGFGRKLMQRIFDLAREENAFVSWTVQPGNERAIAFYKEMGANYNIVGKCGWRSEA